METAKVQDISKNSDIEYHWHKWIFDNLTNGCSVGSMIKTIQSSSSKNKEALIQEVYEAQHHPYVYAAKDMQHTLAKRNWLLETCNQLAALDERYSKKIQKRKTPDFDVFIQYYYSKHFPVVLLGGIDHWPALEHWCPEYFEKHFGDKCVEVQYGRSKDSHYERNSRKYKKKILMREFCQMLVNGGKSNDYYLTANNNQESMVELAGLFDDVGDFGKGYRQQETIKSRSHLWFGPKGAFTPLHHDFTNNMLVQIYGRKKVTIIPAFQVPHIYNDKHVYSAIDFTSIDQKKFPLMENIRPIEVMLNPGEALFIPIGWWHCVEGLDVSMSISFTDFNIKNEFFKEYPR